VQRDRLARFALFVKHRQLPAIRLVPLDLYNSVQNATNLLQQGDFVSNLATVPLVQLVQIVPSMLSLLAGSKLTKRRTICLGNGLFSCYYWQRCQPTYVERECIGSIPVYYAPKSRSRSTCYSAPKAPINSLNFCKDSPETIWFRTYKGPPIPKFINDYNHYMGQVATRMKVL
jgi:hypothetical protein